jgi:hypothetical protein
MYRHVAVHLSQSTLAPQPDCAVPSELAAGFFLGANAIRALDLNQQRRFIVRPSQQYPATKAAPPLARNHEQVD